MFRSLSSLLLALSIATLALQNAALAATAISAAPIAPYFQGLSSQRITQPAQQTISMSGRTDTASTIGEAHQQPLAKHERHKAKKFFGPVALIAAGNIVLGAAPEAGETTELTALPAATSQDQQSRDPPLAPSELSSTDQHPNSAAPSGAVACMSAGPACRALAPRDLTTPYA